MITLHSGNEIVLVDASEIVAVWPCGAAAYGSNLRLKGDPMIFCVEEAPLVVKKTIEDSNNEQLDGETNEKAGRSTNRVGHGPQEMRNNETEAQEDSRHLPVVPPGNSREH